MANNGNGHKQMTTQQKKAVDNIMSGKFKTKKSALKQAGYSDTVASKPSLVLNSKGVQEFIKKLDVVSKRMFKQDVTTKLADVYVEGLEATKLFGKNAIEHPDFAVRKTYADMFMELLGLKVSASAQLPGGNNYNQFNFFSVDKKEQADFNNQFSKFMRNMYSQ